MNDQDKRAVWHAAYGAAFASEAQRCARICGPEQIPNAYRYYAGIAARKVADAAVASLPDEESCEPST